MPQIKQPYDITVLCQICEVKQWSECTFNLTLFYSIVHAPSVSCLIYQPQHTVVELAP